MFYRNTHTFIFIVNIAYTHTHLYLYTHSQISQQDCSNNGMFMTCVF